MSTSYTAILAIGKEFEDSEDAAQFLVASGIATRGEIEDADGVSEWLYDCIRLSGGSLNLHTGYGFYIGFRVSTRCPESFAKDFAEGMEEWDKLFPGTAAEVVHTVRVS